MKKAKKNKKLHTQRQPKSKNTPKSRRLDSIKSHFCDIKAKLIPDKKTKLLLTISIVLASLIHFYGRITYFGDSQTYLQLANHYNPNYYWRGPGYPLLIKMSGFTITGRLTGLLIIQAFLSVVNVMLFYKILLRFLNGKLSFIWTVSYLCTGIPFFFQNTIYPDQIQLTLIYLMIFAFFQFIQRKTRANLTYFLIATYLLTFFRESYKLFSLILIFVTMVIVLINPNKILRKKLIASIIAVSMLWSVTSIQINSYRSSIELANNKQENSFVGRQLFFNTYLFSENLNKSMEENTYFEKLDAELFNFFSNRNKVENLNLATWGNLSSKERYDYFGQFEDKPRLQVNNIWEKPNLTYFWLIVSLTDLYFPPYFDKEIRNLALFIFLENPAHYLLSYFMNAKYLFLGPPVKFSGNYYLDQIKLYPLHYPTVEALESWLPVQTKLVLKQQIIQKPSTFFGKIDDFWSNNYLNAVRLISILSFLSSLLYAIRTFPRACKRRELKFLFFIILIISFDVFSFAVVVQPNFRYQIASLANIYLFFAIVVGSTFDFASKLLKRWISNRQDSVI